MKEEVSEKLERKSSGEVSEPRDKGKKQEDDFELFKCNVNIVFKLL